MYITLRPAALSDAEKIWKMQVEAFADLYQKYHDEATSPAAEPIEKTVARLNQSSTFFYFIEADGETVGAVRVVEVKNPAVPKRISPIFIMPKFRGCGFGKAAVREVERIHGSSDWEIETILEEPDLCRFYESLGYKQTGEKRMIFGNMNLVIYRK